MHRILLLLAGLTVAGALTPVAQADTIVQAPFVRVEVGPHVAVRTPFFSIVVPRRAPVVATPVARPIRRQPAAPLPPPVEYQPIEPGAPPAVPLDPIPARPVPQITRIGQQIGQPIAAPPVTATAPGVPVMTLNQFASTFRAAPTPANYEVFLVHPCTGSVVKVCFSLPGCPRRVKAWKTSVVFRYGLCKAVFVDFNRDGTVRVR